jgi:hypothetical protein
MVSTHASLDEAKFWPRHFGVTKDEGPAQSNALATLLLRFVNNFNEPDPSSRRQFCLDYIIATPGYDFQEGQAWK